MNGPRILIPDAGFAGEPDLEREVLASLLQAPGGLIEVHRMIDHASVPVESWRRADAVILCGTRLAIGDEAAALLRNCRVLVRAGSDVDHIDLEACATRGIPVCHLPESGVGEAADHALAMVLALRRGLPSYADLLNLDPVAGWQVAGAAPLVGRLAGQVFGIVGFGRVGHAVAHRARAFGCRVLYYDPHVDGGDRPGAERCASLDQLLAASDIVSLHCPLTAETRGLIGAAQLARLKPDAILVNTARGGLVDLDALAAALRQGRPGGAGLDVLPEEPPDPDHELIAAWRLQPTWLAGRLILSPHAAAYSPEAARELRTEAAATVREALLGRAVRHCVNLDRLDPLRPARPPFPG